MKSLIKTLIVLFACLGAAISLNCLSCQDENGKPTVSCSGGRELVVTACSTEEPVCGMYFYKDSNGVTLETGCVAADFCNLKIPTTNDFVEHNCRMCDGIDICNSRFLKPQGVGPTSTVQTQPTEAPQLANSSPTVKLNSTTSFVDHKNHSHPINVTQNPILSAGQVPNEKPSHTSKPNSASTMFYSATLIVLMNVVIFWQRKFQ